MTNFAIGESAIFVCDIGLTPDPDMRAYDDQDATVIAPLGDHVCYVGNRFAGFTYGYVIQFADGTQMTVEPHEVRKRVTARQAMLDCIERARMGQGAHA